MKDIDTYIGTDKLVSIEIKNGLRLRGQILSYCEESNMIRFKTLKKTSDIVVRLIGLRQALLGNVNPKLVAQVLPDTLK